MQGKVFTGVFTQYGRRVSRVRVSVKIRIRFRFIYVGDPTCSHHSLAVIFIFIFQDMCDFEITQRLAHSG